MLRKNVLLIGCIFLFAGLLQAQGEKKGPVFEYKESSYDYGVIYLDDMPETKLEIEFTNTGDEPLVVSHVRACCGTRVTDWTKEPIMPGEEGTINIEFRLAPRPHRISRTVMAATNMEGNQTQIFRIRGEVKERE